MAAISPSLVLVACVVAGVGFPATGSHAAAQKYLNPQFAELTKDHKTIAILPFKVTIDKNKLPKNVTLEMVAASEKEESVEFQKQLYARFLQRAQEDQYRVGFQDVDQTNALLARSGISLDSLSLRTKDEIAKALGVDALV